LDAWRTLNFWQRNSVTTPFNVTGGPALVQCIGFTDDGLPLSMQVAGRPFADAMVMRVAKAYEDATPWRRRRPELQAGAAPLPVPPMPPPAKADISRMRRDEIAVMCKRRGLKLPEHHFEQLCATAPFVEAMVGHLGRSWDFADEPASVFQFGG
jgi:aspartyl-tRNA(Asn)/glutamyl-tRNA(Gln) amidotransferase subunit A